MKRINLMASLLSPAPSFAHHQLPTPSSFSFSVASATTRWTSIHLSGLFLRFSALVLSFVAALSLANPLKGRSDESLSFTEYPELLYCFIASIVCFVYSAFQLFKGVCDISYRGILISDKFFDYLSFILDQMVAYLLISSSSVGIRAIQEAESGRSTLWKSAIISVSISFAMFVAVATCALLSGYKLCKRIIW